MGAIWQFLKIPLRVAAVIAAVYLGYVLLARHTADQRWAASHSAPADPEAAKKFDSTYGGSAVKILQFYAREGVITDERSTIICYGVVNAKSVTMNPPVDGIYPALNKCVEVSPRHDTKYTLTAVGNDGQTATADFTIAVKPDTEHLPRVTKFEVTRQTVEDGKRYYTIEFAFENARKVMIDPPVFAPVEDAAPFGKWLVTPESTTTYTLTVIDAKGHKASKKLTVEVPKK